MDPQGLTDSAFKKQEIGAYEEAVTILNRALALDPNLPEVLSSMGWNRLVHYYDWQGAELLLRRALAVEANNTNALHWLSHVLSWQGHLQRLGDGGHRHALLSRSGRRTRPARSHALGA